MKLVVFGSTGGIGSKVVEQALAEGHEVTAVARRPETIKIQDRRLEIVCGDVLKPETLERPIMGKDVVISAIGSEVKQPTVVYSQGDINIMAAMRKVGVRRLFCISASGLEPGPFVQRVFAKPLLWYFLKESYTDLVRMETAVKQVSDLDWTIVRPPQLTDGPRTGKYNSAVNSHVPGCWKISRADVADYMLTHVNSRDTFKGIVEVAY